MTASGDGLAGAGAGEGGRWYFRQLLAGRDVASGDPLAVQMRNYAYAIGDRSSGVALLVDPAYAPAELVAAIEADGLRLAGVVLTHYHADHAGGSLAGLAISGVAELLEIAEVPVHVQRDELEWLVRATGVPLSAFQPHRGGEAVALGGLELRLLHTPGHTPGSQCLLAGGRLLTGDTLFLTGCGRTDLPGGDPDALYASLRSLASLPAGVEVYAGHAYDPVPSQTLGDVTARNPVLVPMTVEEWRSRFA